MGAARDRSSRLPPAAVVGRTSGRVWAAFELRAMGAEDWVGKLQGVFWPAEVLIVPMIVALVAAWRGWWWPIRLLLHAAWIGFFLYALSVIRVS